MAALMLDGSNIPNQSNMNKNNSSESAIILRDTFLSFPKAKLTQELTLSSAGITYSLPTQKNGEVQRNTIPAADLTGCQVMRGKSSQDNCVYMCVYSYPKKKKALSSKVVRKRTSETFILKKYDTFDENLKVALLWSSAILNVARGVLNMSSDCSAPPRKPVLVLCNPCSGPGKALQLFQERVVPMLAEACVPYHLVVTDHAGHATEICKCMDLSKWYGVVIMSGDGLIYEAINGLMQREDWEEAIKIPLGCLPGGSGNALCCSFNYYAGEQVKENPVLHSSFVLLKHQIQPMDLVAVDTLAGRSYSFLSVMWGLTADVDIESEKYRYLGDARFTVGALARIFGLRTYRGKISFLPKERYEHHRPTGMVRSRSTVETTHTDHSRPPKRSETMSAIADGIHSYGDGQDKLSQSHQSDVTIDEEKTVDLEAVTPSSQEIVNDTNLNVNGAGGDIWKDKLVAPPTTLLPPLDEPIPSNWVTLEDEFITVSITYQSHLSRDLFMTPKARQDDGIIHLTLVRAGLTKMRLIELLGAIETGAHVDSPDLENIEVLAFRVEPVTEGGTIMVDGEKVPYGPVQGQILPSIARVMSLSQ